ncbi:MAG TPA: prepilin-type N-terminal cleavage/methylation domain-containing protein [Gemmatimonadales bacterium]|nr:prepilin-type N-terminal cleavage/methylation domain-containing protein [Gemmatimonadales bacterium]
MRKNTAGFTLIEVSIALVILTVSLMIVPLAGMKFNRAVSTNRMRNEANALADAWVARCRAEPNYAALDSSTTGKCKGTVTNLGTYAFTRTTTVVSDATLSGVADSLNDYKRITITVTATGLSPAVTRTITIANR